MSQTSSILSIEQCFTILQRLKKHGLTVDERDELVAKALVVNSGQVDKFLKDIKDSSRQIQMNQEVFVNVTIQLTGSGQWSLLMEWIELSKRWMDCLRESVTVASDTTEIIRRFDHVYLAKVENIKTDQDRLDAIAALEPFIVELDNDESANMSRHFLDLKRDIAAFAEKWNRYATQTLIIPLTIEIKALDDAIAAVQSVVGDVLGAKTLVGLGVCGSVSEVACSLQFHRQKKAAALVDINRVTAALSSLVAEPALLQSSQTPDLTSLIESLGVFAEIWSVTRSQTVQFNEHIKGSLGAATDSRFKREVRLAREACAPLREGLQEYQRQVEDVIRSQG